MVIQVSDNSQTGLERMALPSGKLRTRGLTNQGRVTNRCQAALKIQREGLDGKIGKKSQREGVRVVFSANIFNVLLYLWVCTNLQAIYKFRILIIMRSINMQVNWKTGPNTSRLSTEYS